LSNIDDEGRFIKDEAFVFKGKEVMRRAGSSARGLLKQWVKLRQESAEVRTMLESIDVYQQPSGFTDSVIMAWVLEAQSERVPQAIHQRDLFAAALSEPAKRMSYLCHQLQAWIGGKMTSVLQLTDTDCSFVLKAAANREKDCLKRQMRQKAIQSQQVANFRCGPFEILRIAFAGHQSLVDENIKSQFVLKGLRRNGMLSWRPQGKELVRADSQQWSESMPEGSHRYPKAWLEGRYGWLKDGIPEEPKWERCSKIDKDLEAMVDPTCHGEPGTVIEMKCNDHKEEEPMVMIECDEEGLEAELSRSLYEELKQQELEGEVNKFLKSPTTTTSKKAMYRKKRKLERRGMRKAMRSWRLQQREMMSKYSRKQLIEALIPEASKTKKYKAKQGKKIEGTSKTKAKVRLCA
jgi:hypothetical protein